MNDELFKLDRKLSRNNEISRKSSSLNNEISRKSELIDPSKLENFTKPPEKKNESIGWFRV